MPIPTSRLLAVGAVGVGLLATGCGGATTIDPKKAEDLVHKAVSAAPGAQQPTTVTCPSGVTAKSGNTLTCQIGYADGTKGTVVEHIQDSSGNARIGPGDLHLDTSGTTTGTTSTSK